MGENRGEGRGRPAYIHIWVLVHALGPLSSGARFCRRQQGQMRVDGLGEGGCALGGGGRW